MQYWANPKNGDQISRLGLGCMRFPRNGGNVDQPQVNLLIRESFVCGVNYFDTAYIYPGSERALGTALKEAGQIGRAHV